MAAKKKQQATPTRAVAKKTARDAHTLTKIEKLARGALTEVGKGQNPAVELPMRALSNVAFNEKKKIIELGDKTQSREFFNVAMARKFMQTMLIASKCKVLLDESKTVSIRQMFYMTKHTLAGTEENTFEDQDESDPIIEDLEVGIDALREELHLFANRRGLVVGKLTVNDAGAWGAIGAFSDAPSRARAAAGPGPAPPPAGADPLPGSSPPPPPKVKGKAAAKAPAKPAGKGKGKQLSLLED